MRFFFGRIIKIEVSFVNRGQSLTTLTESLIIPDFTKAETNQNCTEENNDKHSALVKEHSLKLHVEIVHCARTKLICTLCLLPKLTVGS